MQPFLHEENIFCDIIKLIQKQKWFSFTYYFFNARFYLLFIIIGVFCLLQWYTNVQKAVANLGEVLFEILWNNLYELNQHLCPEGIWEEKKRYLPRS